LKLNHVNKKPKTIKKWRKLTQGLLRMAEMKKNIDKISTIQKKVLQTNNFTTEEDEEHLEKTLKEKHETLVIDDLKENEEELTESVNYLKLQVSKVCKRQRLCSRFSLMQKFKQRMLAVIKARPIRKRYQKVKKAVRVLQKHFKKIIAKRIKNKIIKDEFTLKKLRQQQFIAKQRELIAQKKKRKQAVLTIEKYMYKKIIKKKYKLLRKRLAKIPKEMRIVYFKYMALKKDTSSLVSQFNEVMPEG